MPVLTAVLVLGLACGIIIATVMASLMPQDMPWVNKIFIVVVAVCPISVVLFWVVLVDMNTVPGVNRHAEETVENLWYGKATSLSYQVCLGLAGLASLAASLLGSYQVATTLTSVVAIMMVVFVLSYVGVRFVRRG